MARAYSADLRERVTSVCNEEGLSVAEAARRYRLGERTVYRWRWIVRQEGRCCAMLHRGGRQAVVTGREDVLRQLVVEANDATLADYAVAFGERTGRALELLSKPLEAPWSPGPRPLAEGFVRRS